MTRRILFITLSALLSATAALAQREGCLWWGYHHADDVPDSHLGVSKAAVYEAAMRVSGEADPTRGAVISGVRLPFTDVSSIDSLTLWVAPTLEQQPTTEVFVGKPHVGWNVVQLPAAVAVPDTGLYVGYTFRVTQLDGQSERPLVMCNDVTDGGLWLRVAEVKAYREWYTTRRYGSLAMQLEMSGPAFLPCDVSVDAMQQNNMVAQSQDSLQLMFTTRGTQAVQTLQYSYDYGGAPLTGSYELPAALPRVYGMQGYASVPISAAATTGRLPLNFTLSGVNGQLNGSSANTGQASVLSLQRRVHHLTVMEEYTGTWCSACPRGFAGIARLKQMYPDDFVAISVHALNGDPMDVYYDYYYVMNTTLFPGCRFDRGPVTDPYDGDITDGHFHADLNFRAANAVLAPAELSVSAQWADDSLCTIESKVNFLFDDDDCRYQLAYVMTEDSLRGPDGDHAWHQMNSFSNEALAYYVEDDMQQYVNAEGTMLTNVVYNDVAISMSDVRGIEGSLSGAQVAGQPMHHSYELRRSAVSQNARNIRIVALLIDRLTRRVANAAVCTVSGDPSAIAAVGGQQQHPQQCFDLQGRRADHSSLITHHSSLRKGIVLVRQADGTMRKQFIN